MVCHLDANMICVCVITTITIKIIPLRIDTEKYRLRHLVFSSILMKITKITRCTRVPVFLMGEEEDVTVHFIIFFDVYVEICV